jgi:hypothetical protein
MVSRTRRQLVRFASYAASSWLPQPVAEPSQRLVGDADPAAIREWVIQNECTDSIELELPGVTYNLRSVGVSPTLEMVATD